MSEHVHAVAAHEDTKTDIANQYADGDAHHQRPQRPPKSSHGMTPNTPAPMSYVAVPADLGMMAR